MFFLIINNVLFLCIDLEVFFISYFVCVWTTLVSPLTINASRLSTQNSIYSTCATGCCLFLCKLRFQSKQKIKKDVYSREDFRHAKISGKKYVCHLVFSLALPGSWGRKNIFRFFFLPAITIKESGKHTASLPFLLEWFPHVIGAFFLIWSSSAFVVADVSAVDWKNGIVQIWECREKAKFKSVSLVQLFPITTRILLYYWRVVDFKKWRHYFVGRNNEGRVKGVKRKLEFLLHIFTDGIIAS